MNIILLVLSFFSVAQVSSPSSAKIVLFDCDGEPISFILEDRRENTLESNDYGVLTLSAEQLDKWGENTFTLYFQDEVLYELYHNDLFSECEADAPRIPYDRIRLNRVLSFADEADYLELYLIETDVKLHPPRTQ